MTKGRKIKTTIRSHEVYVIRTPRRLGQAVCAECAEQVVLISLDEAVKLSGASSRTIHQLIEDGRIHFTETTDGLALICPASLMNRVSKQIE